MVKNFRVNLAFAKKRDDDLADFGDGVATGMTANGSFPAPPFDPVTGLKPVIVTFRAAILAAKNGGTVKVLTSAKKDAREALISALRKQAAYVQGIAGQDMTMLISSGFKANSTNRASVTLDTPSILSISNRSTTKLVVKVTPGANRRVFQARACVSGGAWGPVATSTDSRKITIDNLVPGAIYIVQVRAVGGAAGYSDWSNAVTIMCT